MPTRIEELGLVDKVNELKATRGYASIAKIINEKFLPEGEEPISTMAVQRYFKKQNAMLVAGNGLEQSDEPNPYDELKALSEKIDSRLESLGAVILHAEENIKKHNKEHPNEQISLKDDDNWQKAIALQERLVARRQSLLNDIAKYQSEIGTYSNLKEIIRIMVSTLKQFPGAYELFRLKVNSNVELKNLCK